MCWCVATPALPAKVNGAGSADAGLGLARRVRAVIDLRDATVGDHTGAQVPVAGELLAFVEHVSTPEGNAVAERLERVLSAGTPCRLVSVDAPAALASFRKERGLRVPLGSDPEGALLGRLGRMNPATGAAFPGWAQVGRDGWLVAMGDGGLPPALLAWSEHAGAAAAPPGAPAAGSVAEWLYPTLATALVVAVLLAWTFRGEAPPGMADPASPTGSSEVAAEAVADAAGEGAFEEEPAAERATPRSTIGGGWYAVPPSLSGSTVRFSGGVLEVKGSRSSVTPMACLAEEASLSGPVVVKGEWSLDSVGTAKTKGARVALRLLGAEGRLMPAGSIPGGSQLFVAQGRRSLSWTAFEGRADPHAGVASVRLCVDNRAGSGTVRVRNVEMRPLGG